MGYEGTIYITGTIIVFVIVPAANFIYMAGCAELNDRAPGLRA